MSAPPAAPPASRRLDPAVIAGVLVALGALALAGPFLVGRLNAPPDASRQVVYYIPRGTAEVIRAGGDPKIVPGEMLFTLGLQDILVIHNDDDVGHTFGPYWVAAHNTLRVQFSQPAVYEGYCSVHPSQQVRIVVQNRSSS